MSRITQFLLTRFHSKAAVLAIALILCWAIPAAAQYSLSAGGAATTARSAVGQTSNLQEAFPAVRQRMKFCVSLCATRSLKP